MNSTAVLIISLFYDFLLIGVLTIGISRYKTLNIPFKILTWSIAGAFIIAMLNYFFTSRYKINAPVLHLEAISGFTFYSLAFYYLFNNQKVKNIIMASVALMGIFFILNALFLQKPFENVFPTNINLPTLSLLVIFSLLLFRQMLLYPLKTSVLKQGVFWFNTAIIFYSTTMFLNIGLSNFFKTYRYFDYFLFYYWYTIVSIFTVLIGVALITYSKENNKTHAV